MRHQVRGRKLNRTSSHRLATMRALSSALIKNQKIVTTVAKAKELRTYVEPLITRARKEDTPHNRRQVFSFLNDKEAVIALYDDVIPVVGDREGGYTRVIKIGRRQSAGDGAPMAVIELVDFNDVKPEGKTSKKKRTRRAGRKKATTSATDDATTADEKPKKTEAKTDTGKAEKPKAEKVAKEDNSEKAEAAEIAPKAEAKAATDKAEESKAEKVAKEDKAEKAESAKAETAEKAPKAETDKKETKADADEAKAKAAKADTEAKADEASEGEEDKPESDKK